MTKYYLRKKKVETNECDVACAQPFVAPPDGMGPVIPMVSGDRFDTVLGGNLTNVINYPKKKYKVKRKKK